MTRRRGPNEGSITKRKDGRWEAKLYLGYDHTGKRKRKSLFGKTRHEVAEKLRAAIQEYSGGLDPANGRLNVAQFLRSWHDTNAPRWRPTRELEVRRVIETGLIPALGRIPLRKLTPEHIQRYYQGMTERGCAPGTIKNHHNVLHPALKEGLRWGVVDRNVSDLAVRPRVTRKKTVPLDADETRIFLDTLTTHRDGPLFLVAATLGIRQAEALGLTWEDIDFRRRVVTVRHQLQRLEQRFHFTAYAKTHHGHREIALGPELVDALKRQRVQQKEDQLRAGPLWEGTTGSSSSPTNTGAGSSTPRSRRGSRRCWPAPAFAKSTSTPSGTGPPRCCCKTGCRWSRSAARSATPASPSPRISTVTSRPRTDARRWNDSVSDWAVASDSQGRHQGRQTETGRNDNGKVLSGRTHAEGWPSG